MRSISPSEAFEVAKLALAIKEVPYFSGPPGIGKSDIMKQVAKHYNIKFIDVRLSQMLPEDMTGLPNLNETKSKAVYTPFETFPMEGDEIPEGYNGWLILLDELSSASEECMAAAYSIILDHMVGGKKIHPEARIVAAGNRSTDSAIARPLPDTLITRLLPLDIKPSVKDWLAWANSEFSESNSHTISFIEKYPDMLNDMSSSEKREELEPYTNPRSWGKVMKIINLFEKIRDSKKPREDIPGIPVPDTEEFVSNEPINDVTFHMLEGAIGSIAASAYKEDYNESLCLPNAWECAQAPAAVAIPSTGAGKATLTNTLAKYFLAAKEEAREGILGYMNRMGGEYTSLFTQIINDNLGETSSETKLIETIKKRLNVDDFDLGDFPNDAINPCSEITATDNKYTYKDYKYHTDYEPTESIINNDIFKREYIKLQKWHDEINKIKYKESKAKDSKFDLTKIYQQRLLDSGFLDINMGVKNVKK